MRGLMEEINSGHLPSFATCFDSFEVLLHSSNESFPEIKGETGRRFKERGFEGQRMKEGSLDFTHVF